MLIIKENEKIKLLVRIFILSSSVSIMLDLLNLSQEKVIAWVLTLFIYSIIMIKLILKEKKINQLLVFFLSAVVGIILTTPIYYLKIPNYFVYILIFTIFYTYYFSTFKYGKLEPLIMSIILHSFHIILLFSKMNINESIYFTMIIFSIFLPIFLLDSISWKLKGVNKNNELEKV